MSDTFWWMLAHPAEQKMSNLTKHVTYVTDLFDATVYSAARKVTFDTFEAAYQDWRDFGRVAGLQFAHGYDTVLKIIVKVRDENELFVRWIEYHAKVIGYHNLIVIDCGSTDQEFLKLLELYKLKVIVFRYDQYYDHIHHYHANREFYNIVTKECRYLCVLDADEFLFGRSRDSIHLRFVLDILRDSELPYFAGSWFFNTDIVTNDNGAINWDRPIPFAIDRHTVDYWTRAGKSVVRSNRVPEVLYLGHNMGDKNAQLFLTTDSFAAIGILHLKTLPETVTRKRALRHLVSKNVISSSIVDPLEIEATLKTKLNTANLEPIEINYIKYYLGLINTRTIASESFSSLLITGSAPETHDKLSMWVDFDYSTLLSLIRDGAAEQQV